MASSGALAELGADLHGPRVVPSPDTDSDTDSEEPSLRRSTGGLLRPQVIHSGHFMVSSPHSDSLTRRRDQEGPVGHSDFGPRSIDPTLTRLFECMSLAYSGKLVSPKWKNFKGLKLLCRDKIRLNNAIWRAWYTQYVERRKSPVCGFVTPLQGPEADEHRKPEAVVLEGNYWKRRIEVVMREYHKWRIYYKKRLRKSSREGDLLAPKQAEGGWQSPERWHEQLFSSVMPVLLGGPEEEANGRQLLDLDSFLSDISDTLFTMTQPSPGPLQLPPEDAYIGNADMIQPGLTPLQPSLDDVMEISDFFTNCRPPPPPTPSNFPEPSSLSPMADPFFSSGILNPEVPPVTPSGMAHLSGNRLQARNSSPGTLESSGYLNSDFILPEDFKPKVSSPASIPPYLHYSSQTKVPGLEPARFPPTAPLPTLLPEESLFSPRFPYPLAPPATGVSPLAAPTAFPPSPQPGSNPIPSPFPVDLLPSGYHPEPALGPRFAVPRSMQPKSKSPTLCPRGQKTSPPTLVPATAGSPAATGGPNPCLTQLLIAAKPEQALGPPLVSSDLHRHSRSPQETVPDFPCTFFPSTPAPTPPRPPPGPATLALPRPLIVPKAERLSPPAPSGVERRLSGELSAIPVPGALTICISPAQAILSRGRPDNKNETRRITHISAEQKRRFNIKLGFDTLHGLVSTLSAQPSLKVSKATTLQKTAEYIAMLQQERAALQEEAQRLRDQIEELNAEINLCQQQLPATGVPITHQRFDQMRDMFDHYVRTRTLHNWKFWVFSILIRPLFESFNGMVSTANLQSLRQTSLDWLDQYCSLPALRPTVLNSLRQLSTSTCILTDPGRIPEQATRAVTEGTLGKPL
ncbi:carbohydrate-responsive element-binding protein [Rhynchocyon petersi]